MTRPVRFLAASAAVLGVSGCLGEPEIEDRWTKVEIVDASPTDADAYTLGGGTPVTVTARITYRAVLTGHLVADLRAASTLTAADVDFHAEDKLDVARDVDLVLGGSTSIGQDAVPVTGWDHLIQEITFTFDGGTSPPTAADSSASATSTPASASGLFLVVYFSDDVQEVELVSGEEIEVVTPTLSTQMDILSTGLEIVPAPPQE